MLIELGRGPLTALKYLLTDPLQFNAQQYVARTSQLSDRADILDLEELVVLFENTKQTIMPRVSQVPLILQGHRKLRPEDISVDFPSPIKFRHPQQDTDGNVAYALRVKRIDTINLHVDRLLESFRLRECNGDQPRLEELAEFLSFYHLGEALFLAFCGFASVKKVENGFLLRPANANAVNQFHREWVAQYWESTSAQANIAYIDFLPKNAINTPYFVTFIHTMGKALRDKIFSIPFKDFSNRLANFGSIELIGKMCNLVALCLWCHIKDEMQLAPYSLLSRVGIRPDDIDQLKQLQSSVFEPDKVFYFREDGVKLANPSFTYQLRQVLVKLFALLPKKESGQLNQALGDYFERDYLRQYFSTTLNELGTRYVVHRSILDHEVPQLDEIVDVDFIVEDCRRQRLLFVQVKYLKAGGMAYFLGDVDYALNESLQRGINQIRAAKGALEGGHLDDILREIGIDQCTLSNSTFMVIHNVPNLDFQITGDGICLYEWNTLRNLLQDARCSVGHTRDEIREWRYHEPLPIESPDKTIEILIAHSPVCRMGGGTALFQSDLVTSEFELSGHTVTCLGLGI